MTMNIRLDNRDDATWIVEGRRVTLMNEHSTDAYLLPKGRPRVSVVKLARHTGQLVIGGFNSTAVTVTGPMYAINAMREAVL